MSNDLGEYLRVRRGALTPEDVGLPRGQRRVPGLRREEVAALAGVSVDYYTRLEQGRERRPSHQVLDALASALDLGHDEYAHLCLLAGSPAVDTGRAQDRPVHPSLLQLLEQWPATPAYVVDDSQQILGCNALGAALHSGFDRPDNYARMMFLDPEGPRFFRDWARIGAATVGSLRRTWAHPAARRRLAPLLDELCAGSAEFDRLWRGHTVASKVREAKRLVHPQVGELTLTFHAFGVTDVEGRHLVVCQAEPGSPSERSLRLLSTLAATPGQRLPEDPTPPGAPADQSA